MGLALRDKISVSSARTKLEQQIAEGEGLFPQGIKSFGMLKRAQVEKQVWVEYTKDQLLHLFDMASVAEEFEQRATSTVTSGDLTQFLYAERSSLTSSIGFLRSIVRRLDFATVPTPVSRIPAPVLAVVSRVVAAKYTHAEIERIMTRASLGQRPEFGSLNKEEKTRRYLEIANESRKPLDALGCVLEELMEVDDEGGTLPTTGSSNRERVLATLSKYGLTYANGGRIIERNLGIAAKKLEEALRSRHLPTVQDEFDRIERNVAADPPAAVTAACALLESLFQQYIEEHSDLGLPSDKSLKPLWMVVRKHLKFDPTLVNDEDLRKILSGLGSIVEGVAAFRTHKGSAHGQSRKAYRIKPRHARLLVHSAATLATFVLETWDERG